MFIAWCIAWALNQCDWILLFSGLYFKKIWPASRFSFVVIILFYYIVIV